MNVWAAMRPCQPELRWLRYYRHRPDKRDRYQEGLPTMNDVLHWLSWTGLHITTWKLIGYAGALMFAARWLVQVWASRRARRPVIPRLFWYLSIAGSLMTLAYFSLSNKRDSVGVLQNLLPLATAIYSLMLDLRHHHSTRFLERGSDES